MITSDPMLLLPILAVGWKGFLLASLVQGIDRSVLSFPSLLQFLLAWESLDLDSQVTLSFHVPFPERHAQPPPRLSNSLPLYHPEAPPLHCLYLFAHLCLLLPLQLAQVLLGVWVPFSLAHFSVMDARLVCTALTE